MNWTIYARRTSTWPKKVEVFLKAHGKSRGYVERKELTGAEGEPLRPFSFKALFEEMAKEEDAG